MTRRERLTRCYFNQELDRPAVYSRSGIPGKDPSYDALRALLEEKTELKRHWATGLLETQPPEDIHTEPYSAEFERRIHILHTPLGDLRRTFLISLKGQPGLHETYLVNSPEDAEKYLSLPMPVVGGDTTPFFAAQAEMGDRGIVDVGLGMNPGGFVAELCGSENFALLSVMERELMHRLCARRMEILAARLKFLLQAGIGPFFSMAGEEYIVPPLHGPADFDDFNVRYDKPLIDLVHETGGRVHVHSHGSVKSVMPGFLKMGVDVLHPFEAPPQGNITAREAKEMVRGRICIEGNIQIHEMYESGPERVRELTAGLIADAFDDRRGLIVSPTASPYIRGEGTTCLPQYQAMIETVLAGRI